MSRFLCNLAVIDDPLTFATHATFTHTTAGTGNAGKNTTMRLTGPGKRIQNYTPPLSARDVGCSGVSIVFSIALFVVPEGRKQPDGGRHRLEKIRPNGQRLFLTFDGRRLYGGRLYRGRLYGEPASVSANQRAVSSKERNEHPSSLSALSLL